MTKDATIAKAGFDLTSISADRWELLLDLFDLNDNGKMRSYPNEDQYSKYHYFEFKNDNLLVVTGNHPITGEYGTEGRRENEVGYASYIGIEGDKELVRKMFKAIKMLAEDIKDENPTDREFI